MKICNKIEKNRHRGKNNKFIVGKMLLAYLSKLFRNTKRRSIRWAIFSLFKFQDELDGIIEKLAKLEAPSIKGASKASADGVYSRLTDHTKYTGAHKERFDAEGKGKGKAGREDIKDDSGYVAAYKNKDTYHKTHSWNYRYNQ